MSAARPTAPGTPALHRRLGRLAARAAAPLALLACALLLGPAARAAGADCPPEPQVPSAAQLEQARAEARDRGFLWRISQGGRSSYLYGTIHVGKLAWAFPGPQVREAVLRSQTLALELDLTDPQIAQRLAPAVQGRQAPPPSAQWSERLARQREATCVSAELLGGQPPVMQAFTLTVMSGRREGLEPVYAQEFMLGGAFRALQRPIVSLETPEQQMAVLVPTDPAEAAEAAEQALQQLEQGQARATLLRLARAWERGELDELSRYEQWCQCVQTEQDRAMLRRLNDERNGPMAERIDALHRAGGTVFAAVGALHMTGPQGLPGLMRQRGYTVERVAFPAPSPE